MNIYNSFDVYFRWFEQVIEWSELKPRLARQFIDIPNLITVITLSRRRGRKSECVFTRTCEDSVMSSERPSTQN